MAEHNPMKPSLDGIVRCEGCDETWPCEVMRLRAGLASCESWIDRWTQHVGRCGGDDRCTCGRTAILYEARAILNMALDHQPQEPEVTEAQVKAIDALVAPEFATGNWETVESDTQQQEDKP